MEQKRLNRKALFETLPVWQAILKLALPSVAGQIILVIYNMADAFFVGLTGSDEKIAAVTLCMPAFLVLSALANLFGVGGASMIARALGDGRHSLARHTAAFSLAGCAACSVLYGLLVWLLGGSFIRLLGGADPAVLGLAQDYLFYTVVLGGAATALNTLFSHLLRAEGRSLQASLGIALGGVLNIGLDPLLMFRLLPAGQETRGAAIATMLSNLISLLYYGAVLFLGRKHSDLSFRPCRAMLEDDIPRGVLSAGLPACLMTLLENLSFAVLEHLMSLQGTAVQAGVGVAKKVNMLAHCIVRGMAQGVLPLIGYSYSSGDHRRMRAVVARSAAFSVATASLCTAVCLLLPRALCAVFLRGGSPSLDYAARFLQILSLGAPFSAWAYLCVSFFQAVGQGRRSFLLASCRKGLVDIPLMLLLRLVSPVFGPCWATPAADLFCCGLAALLFFRFLRGLAKEPELCYAEDKTSHIVEETKQHEA